MLAVTAVYANSLNAPFIFDDLPAVVRNRSIHHLWSSLSPPVNGSGVSGRPLVNFSLSVNYAFGGLEVRGYHLLNLALHALASLVLWGVLRRTARGIWWGLPVGRTPTKNGGRQSADLPTASLPETAELFAGITALLWAVHPLLTESVVCVVQRNEVLGSLFYLLTLYCFIRGLEVGDARRSPAPPQDARRTLRWLGLSWLACLAGVASKEHVVTAPLLVFLYDRTFISGSFRDAWRHRRKFYAALVATWLLLAWLVWHNRSRGGTVGFGLGITPWEYLLTQSRAIVLYLRLSFWPHPLVLDYGWPVVRTLGDVLWQSTLVLTMLAAAAIAFWRKSGAGFLAISFFLLLAPSSSFVPLATQTIAEHRMYLPLATVLGLVVASALTLAQRAGRGGLRLATAGFIAVSLALGMATVKRNADYRTELSIWLDTVAKWPTNARAQGNLGRAYLLLGRPEEAIAASREELRVDPSYRGAGRGNIGRALTELGRPTEALPYFDEGLRLEPDDVDLHNNYGIALAALGRWTEAIAQYEEVLRLQPDFANAHNNLANALLKLGRPAEAISHYEAALGLDSHLADAEANLGRTLAETGHAAEAMPHFEKALLADPDSADAHIDLANGLMATGRPAEAILHYETALRLQPDRALAHFGLGNVLASQGNFAGAITHYEAAVRLQPQLVAAQHNLAAALMRLDRPADALPHYEAVVRLSATSAEAYHELSLVLGDLRRWNEAKRNDEEALRLNPNYAEAKEHLEWLQQQD